LVSGLRFSAPGLDEGRGKVPSPFPHPSTAEDRIPSAEDQGWGPGTRHLGPDTRNRIDAEGRIPSTGDQAGNASIGYASCIVSDQ